MENFTSATTEHIKKPSVSSHLAYSSIAMRTNDCFIKEITHKLGHNKKCMKKVTARRTNVFKFPLLVQQYKFYLTRKSAVIRGYYIMNVLNLPAVIHPQCRS